MKTIIKQDNTIKVLENRIIDLEFSANEMKHYSLKNNVIIKRLQITKPPRTYAAVASGQTPGEKHEIVEEVSIRSPYTDTFKATHKQVVDFINTNMKTNLSEDDICAAHELKKGPMDELPPLVVRFAYTSTKQDVMAARRNIKGRQIYINDQQTQPNSKIFQHARQMVRNGTLASTWTRLGKVFVKKNDHSRPVWITLMKDLESLL